MSRTTSSHPWSGHHSCGLARADFSRLRLPLRKKSSCSRFSAPSPSSILMVIWNDSISLCFSKSPRQVKLYTSYVSASTTFLRRCSNALSFFDVSKVRWNTVRYMFSEFSYMVLITDRPDMTKNRIEPLFATGAYLTRVVSSSTAVFCAASKFSAISTAFFFVFSSVSMSAALSRMLPCAVASSRRSVSSSCFRSVLLSLISFTKRSRSSSRSGRSCFTVTFRSCSCRPCCVTE